MGTSVQLPDYILLGNIQKYHCRIKYILFFSYAVDLVVCTALGCDMYDCVYSTRTAVSTNVSKVKVPFCQVSYIQCSQGKNMYRSLLQRFGTALVPTGLLKLKTKKYAKDFKPIDENCKCSTCKNYTRSYLHAIVTHESVACSLVTVHNVQYQASFNIAQQLLLSKNKSELEFSFFRTIGFHCLHKPQQKIFSSFFYNNVYIGQILYQIVYGFLEYKTVLQLFHPLNTKLSPIKIL